MAWLVRNPEVECSELEDGAVLLNMETRLYYSLNQTGLELWNAIDAAEGPEQVARRLTGAFEIEERAALGAVSRFVGELQREGLVVASDGAPAAPTPEAVEEGGPRRAFQEPQLIKHDEPLHEVVPSPFDPQLPLAE
jgi:hypothetical protein